MAYVSLYRKYRPQTFAESDIVGQRHVTRTLQHAIAAGRVSHAYLFCGPRGTGKTTAARLLAKALNCESGPTPDPCGKCPNCEAIRTGSSLDVVEIDAASNRGIEDVRDLREKVAFAPAQGRYKVYIIDEVHMLTNEAFNALLKTLEEPPAHVVFVMATTEAHRLPPTILSRCQRFDFHRISLADMVARLKVVAAGEGMEVDEDALGLLARAAEGGMRDALSLLEQAQAYASGRITAEEVQAVLGGVQVELLVDLAQAVARQDAEAAFRLVERVVSEGKDIRALVAELVGHFRNLLMLATVRDESLVALPPSALARLSEQARDIPVELLARALETLCEAERELRWATQQRLVLELAMLRLCRPPAAVQPAPGPQPVVRPTARPAPTTPKEAAPAGASEPETPAPVLSEQTAAPVAASGATGEELLMVLRGQWAAVLQRLRTAQKGRQLAAFLMEAEPVEASGSVVTLGFRQQFHCDAMSDPKRIEGLQQVLAEDFGLRVTIRCVMLKGEGKPGVSGPSVIAREVMKVFPGSMEVGDQIGG